MEADYAAAPRKVVHPVGGVHSGLRAWPKGAAAPGWTRAPVEGFGHGFFRRLARRAARSMRPGGSRRVLAQGADRVFALEGFHVTGRSGNVNRSTHAEQAPARPPRRGATGPSLPAAAAIRSHRRAVGRGQRSEGHASTERVRCILPRVHGHRPGTVRGAEPTAGSSLDFGNHVTDRKTLTHPRLRQAPSCHGRMGPSIRNKSAEQLLFHPTGWLSTATTMTVWIGNSHRHYRPGLPSMDSCFLSRVLLASSIASTDWMYSAIYSGGRPCSLPPARTKSLYQL